MLKVWTRNENENVLILGLTFKAAGPRDKFAEGISDLIVIRQEELGLPADVVLVTASDRKIISKSLKLPGTPAGVSREAPVWHFVRRQKQKHLMYICLDRAEMWYLRARALVSFYRLPGAAIGADFDTVLAGCTSEKEMISVLRKTRVITPDSRIGLDQFDFRC